MTGPLFTINFRRASWEQNRAAARRRVLVLGGSVAYAGLLAIAFGLFGLNCALMQTRTAVLERRVQRFQTARAAAPELSLDPADVMMLQGAAGSARLWCDKLTRLSAIFPPNARLTALVINPDRSLVPAEQRRLRISGSIRTTGERDRLQPVVRMIEALRKDPIFSAGYQNIKLVSSRVPDSGGTPQVEFVVECQ